MKLAWWSIGFSMGAAFVSFLAYFDGWMPMGSCAVTHDAPRVEGDQLSQTFYCAGKAYIYLYNSTTDKQYFLITGYHPRD